MQTQKTSVQKIINKGGVTKLFCYSLLSLSITNALAEEATLDTINVIDTPESIQNKKVGETVKTAKTLEKQQISSTRDLVKYETGITVVEKGRMGASGYAVRGVEENRVNITIDGLAQAQTISSQGFKELFEGYGNFNNTRNGIEVETIKQVNLAKGSDSTKVGSGALGGAVIFETKDARDFLMGKDFYYKFKTGYATANNEKMFSHTLAGRFKDFDALVIRTDRDGHELENFGYDDYPDIPELGSQGRSRQKADPYNISKESTLFKLSYNPNENNRFTVMYDDYKNHSKGTDWSYTLAPMQTERDKPEVDSRHTNDKSNRRNVAFMFENYSETPLWDSLKVSVSKQKISQKARTDEYCDGVDACRGVQNPLGIQLKDGKLVDNKGNEIAVGETEAYDYSGKKNGERIVTLVDKNGKELPYPDETENWEGKMIKRNQKDLWSNATDSREVFLDCSKFDCSGSIRYHHISGNKFVDDKKYADIDLNKEQTVIVREWPDIDWDSNWNQIDIIKRKKTVFVVEDIKRGGAHYKHILPQETNWDDKGDYWNDPNYEGWRADAPSEWSKTGKVGYNNSDEYRLILPGSRGYETNIWTDRSLNTDTLQLKLDLTKFFTVKDIDNDLAYGISYEKTEKSMINYTGYGSINHKWWAISDMDDIDENGNPTCNKRFSIFCNRSSGAETFLMPVVTKSGEFHISDNIRINDKVAFDLGYRYDRVSHKPHYKVGVDPALPKGLYDGVLLNGTAEENMEYLAKQKRKFSNSSYSLAGIFDPTDYLRIQAKYSTGFRIPTSDELYFTFKHPDFSIKPNLDLKVEKAKTKEVALTFHKNNSFITLGAFRTDYQNFIELAFKGYTQFKNSKGQTSGIPYRLYQNRNNSKAKVQGLSIAAKLYLSDLLDKPNGFNIGYKFEYQKGKTFGIDTDSAGNEREMWHAINAIQPMKQILSVGYVSPEQDYGFDIFYTHASAKKKTASYNPYHGADQGIFNGPDEGTYAKHLSKAYNVFDVIGFYKPIKDLTIQAGVYNLFDQEYATWESIRSIRQFGTSNMICKKATPGLGCGYADQGIERFSAPGRNFKLNLSYEF
ncbi:TonB-dependent receptor domain-containing protein [Pasteurella atlantica]|uniref:TonB-dependent receptor domain-containing protein n=1 Tax=Pasteurellaceae TaxID=712 RepID=UPI00275CC8E1|nr:TonB-dependent receptor [Pasteurella atlantica]MDP8099084.1 TonB-dependent receptor [Pasteurella atlantica]MDP8107110.1 TonB-dependent receptor [Pasteurella atlantica]MDP8116801.1 TonB-dependent receptor [Pasteurella atlantica]